MYTILLILEFYFKRTSKQLLCKKKITLIQKLTYADFLTDYFLESFAMKSMKSARRKILDNLQTGKKWPQ